VRKAGTGHHPKKKERMNVTVRRDVVMSNVKDVYGMNARIVLFQYSHSA
jgi:hypothetical protein